MINNVYVALIHHPVLNKYNEVVTTSVTNLDIHDISRTCCTFGIKKFFIVNRLETQEKFVDRITKFWKTDIAQKFNSDRVEALEIAEYAKTIKDATNEISKQEGMDPIVISTTAKDTNLNIKFNEIKDLLNNKPILILFGTGNGLAQKVHDNADYVMEPIKGKMAYNHLSVRSAVAIILDRILSDI